MKKQELIKEIANELEISQVRAGEVIDALGRIIENVIETRDEVILCGMKIGTKDQKGRDGEVNNEIGHYKFSTPDKIVPYVKFTKSTKERLSVEK